MMDTKNNVATLKRHLTPPTFKQPFTEWLGDKKLTIEKWKGKTDAYSEVA